LPETAGQLLELVKISEDGMVYGTVIDSCPVHTIIK
jgi:hypothetical protein